jgi:hypothetical protein
MHATSDVLRQTHKRWSRMRARVNRRRKARPRYTRIMRMTRMIA